MLPAATAADVADGATVAVPVVELPDLYQGGIPGWPALDDANDVAVAVDRLVILGEQRAMHALLPENDAARKGVGMGFAGLTAVGTVLVGAWAHEEARRAVLRQRGIPSRNGLYHPETWSNGTISVDHVTDADLARLKADHPADTVRLMSAGIETQHLIVRQIGDTTFRADAHGGQLGPFYLGDTWMAPTMLAETASTILYLARCQGEDSDLVTDAENQLRTEELDRDFTGLDCTAWVYDMRRPEEPYEDRGAHPYGTGVDRYRSHEDLTEAERAWLEQQFFLNLVNLANPHLYGIDGVSSPGGDRWIVSLGWLPAPWGCSIDVRGGVRTSTLTIRAELHGGVSRAGLEPGIDLEVRDLQVRRWLKVGAGAGGWLQPEDQRWTATRRTPGGRVWAEAELRPAGPVGIVLGSAAKSGGFVPGDVHLEAALSGTLALRLDVPPKP